MLLLLLYYHPLQTVLLNIWKDHCNGWVEARLSATVLVLITKDRTLVSFAWCYHTSPSFFEGQRIKSAYSLKASKRRQLMRCQQKLLRVTHCQGKHTTGWEYLMLLSAVSNTNTAKPSHASTLLPFRILSFTFFNRNLKCLAVVIFSII